MQKTEISVELGGHFTSNLRGQDYEESYYFRDVEGAEPFFRSYMGRFYTWKVYGGFTLNTDFHILLIPSYLLPNTSYIPTRTQLHTPNNKAVHSCVVRAGRVAYYCNTKFGVRDLLHSFAGCDRRRPRRTCCTSNSFRGWLYISELQVYFVARDALNRDPLERNQLKPVAFKSVSNQFQRFRNQQL